MNFSALFIKRPVMTLMLMGSIVLMGVLAFFRLPVTDLPGIDYPMMNVSAGYTGASPEVMARIVAVPLEKELMNIAGLKHIVSQSSRGMTWITLMFDLDCDSKAVTEEVQAALKRAESSLPSDLDQKPTYHKADAHQDAIIYLVLTSDSSSLSELYDYAHSRIEQKVAQIEGVGKVEVHGSPYAVRIYLNPELMTARGLTFDEVRSSLMQTTGTVPLGVLDTPGRKFMLELPGSLQNATDFSNLSLKPGVHLKDIAKVVDGLESDQVFHYLNKSQDQLAIIFGIQKHNNANAVNISTEVKKLLRDLKAELPPTMQLDLWFDKANWIKEAIQDVEWSLVLAFALVVAVIYLSLGRLRETLVAATALPLSILGTLIVMQILHFNLDLLSLLALTLAMGFVIDDAIVVLENIVRHREKGLSPLQAALQGSKQISFTIVSMTLSLVAVFIPMLFMQDIIGRLFREFSVTLAVSILVSGVVSLTLTPMLASRCSSPSKRDSHFKSVWLKGYQHSLDWCLRYKKTTLGFGCGMVGLTVILLRFLPIDLFPEEDRGFIWGFIQMPGGMSKKDTELYQNTLNHIARNHAAVEDFVTLNFKDFQIYLIRLRVADRDPQAVVTSELQTQFNAIPGTQAFMRGIQLVSNTMGGFTRNNYQFVLSGVNPDEVRSNAEALQKKLIGNPLFINPDLNLKADSPQLEITLFTELAEKLGLTRLEIQTLLQNAYAGGSFGKIEKNSEQYKVFLELDSQFQKNTAALSKLYLKTASGTSVPLKAVASWKETVGLQTIEHIGMLSSAVVSFDVSKDIPLNEALDTLKEIAAETLTSSVSGKFEGLADMADKTSSDTLVLLLLAVVAMYLVLGILYESFIHPLTILSALPFACLGGILTLLIFREPLSLYSMVGFFLLMGIVKKNGIMMVDYALEVQKTEDKSPLDAIREACAVRFRPIMMTTIAAVMGSIPIAIGIGAGAETRRGLGLVIAGGLLFSQFLTLYITPILYLYFEKLRSMRNKELGFNQVKE